MELGSTAGCRKTITEAAKGLGQRYIKGDIKDCFLFDS